MKYVIAAHSHPPCGWRYCDSTKQHGVNLLVASVRIILKMAGKREKHMYRDRHCVVLKVDSTETEAARGTGRTASSDGVDATTSTND